MPRGSFPNHGIVITRLLLLLQLLLSLRYSAASCNGCTFESRVYSRRGYRLAARGNNLASVNDLWLQHALADEAERIDGGTNASGGGRAASENCVSESDLRGAKAKERR